MRFVVFHLKVLCCLLKSARAFTLSQAARTGSSTRGRKCSNTECREAAPLAEQLLPRSSNLSSAPAGALPLLSGVTLIRAPRKTITADWGHYYSNTYLSHEKQLLLRQNVLSQRYFSLMMFFFYGASAIKPGLRVTGMRNEKRGGSEMDLIQTYYDNIIYILIINRKDMERKLWKKGGGSCIFIFIFNLSFEP